MSRLIDITIASTLLTMIVAGETLAAPKPDKSKGSGSQPSGIIAPKLTIGGGNSLKLVTPSILPVLPVSPSPSPKLLGPGGGNKKDYTVVKLGLNGHLDLPWATCVPKHHHHHHHHHWCDCDFIDLAYCVILDRGVLILELNDGTADDEGMNVGDVILSINGKATPDIDTLCDIVQQAGDVV